jgi:hypothetical protein
MSGLCEVRGNLRVALQARHAGSVKSGVEAKLGNMLMRYYNDIGGVVLGFWNIKLLEDKGRILPTDPSRCIVNCTATMLVLRFKVNDRMIGKVSKVGKDHIALVVMDAFSVAIPGKNIGDEYKYDGASASWKRKNQGICEGDMLAFEVESMNEENGYFSVVGSILNHGTGIVSGDNKGPMVTKEEESPQSKKKRKTN